MDFNGRLEDVKKVLTTMGPRYAARLDNENMILTLVRKLPNESLKRKWTYIASDIMQSKGQVNFADFLSFIQKRADCLNNRFGQELKPSPAQNDREIRSVSRDRQEPPRRATTLHVAADNNAPRRPGGAKSATLKCYHCSGSHAVWQCESFRSAPYEERLRTVQLKRLCGSCLGQGHFKRDCMKKFTCRKPGCGKRHHFLIHPPDKRNTTDPAVKASSVEQGPAIINQSSVGGTAAAPIEPNPSLVAQPVTVSCTFRESAPVETSRNSRPRVCLKVVSVKVSGLGSDKQITTYAFRNNGSDATLCLRGLLKESGLESESTDFRLTTVNHAGKEYGRRASLKIEALDGKTKFTLDQVLTTERLPIGEKHFTNNRELRKWPHLDGIYLPQVDERKVSILIGSNRPDIIDNNSEIRRRTKGQSYAVNTPLG